MTLDQFTQKWLGKRVDRDGVYAYQCVDLIIQYLAEVHGITSGVNGNAIDYWTKPSARLLQDFEKVTGTPQKGDIVILNPTSSNPYGHIMVAVNGTTAIEQNGATGDGDGLGGDEVRYRTIPLNRVAGLLRKKGNEVIDENSTAALRIGHSEIGGWDVNKTHAGEYDKLFHSAWDGKDFNEFLYAQWLAGGGFREQRIKALAENPVLKTQVGELTRTLGVKDGEITRLSKENESLKAQVGDNTKWETLKALVRELVGK